jgi:hypothetical protein
LVADKAERDGRKEFLDRSFELHKHISTICIAASLLILAVFRERPFDEGIVAVTLVILVLDALSCLYGMVYIATEVHPYHGRKGNPRSFDRFVYVLNVNAVSMIAASGVVFALYLADVSAWIVFGVLGVLFVALVALSLILWKKRRGT